MDQNYFKDFPNQLKLPSNGLTFSISSLSVLVTCGITFLSSNNLDFSKKIIICLAIACLVLIIDVIILFIKEREHYYYSCFLKQYLDATNKHVDSAQEELNELNSRLNSLSKK